MRVVLVDQVGTLSGVGMFLHGLVRGLLEEPAARDWSFEVVQPQRDYSGNSVAWPADIADRRLTVELDGDVKDSLDGRGWIESHLRGRTYDVAYFACPFQAACPELDAPMVATPHDFNFKRFATWAPALRRLVDEQLEGWMRRCDVLVVSSRFIASELTAYYPEAAGRTRVVRLGVPAGGDGELAPSPVEPPFLLSVGWVTQHKNQAVIFRALADLRKEGLDIPLVLTGPNARDLVRPDALRSSYAWHVRRLAEGLGLEPGRDYLPLGYVSRGELDALYRSATALVMPTLYEAGSFPIREALQRACPVICSDIPPLREELEVLGGGAATFDPYDPHELAARIRELLADEAGARRRAAEVAPRVDSAFEWRATARGYLAAFQSALAAARAA